MNGDWRSADARAGLVWGLVFLLAVQVGLVASRSHWVWFAHDPEFAFRLAALRKQRATHPDPTPLVLLLGSSRTACGIQPDKFPPIFMSGTAGKAPRPSLVFNFALCRSGPFAELLCLRRLLDRGIWPGVVLLEVWQPFYMGCPSDAEAKSFAPNRVHLRELPWYLRYHPEPERLLADWAKLNALPVLGLRDQLLLSFAPFVFPPNDNRSVEWRGLDGSGWLRIEWFAPRTRNPLSQGDFKAVRDQYVAAVRHGVIHESTERAMRELLGLCQKHRIAVKFMLYPDAFARFYPPEALSVFERSLQSLGKEWGAEIVDLRDTLPREAFMDGVHLTHTAAATFSERLGREVLRPMLERRLDR